MTESVNTRPSTMRRVATGMLGIVCAAGALTGSIAATRLLPADEHPAGGVQPVAAAPASVTAICPPGVVNSFAPTAQGAPASVWSSAPQDIHTGTLTTLLTRAHDGHISLPSSLSVAGQGGGDLRGLSLIPCRTASTDQWFAAGATTAGEDLVLALSNSGNIPSVVTISALGATGTVGAPQQVTVPAGQTIFALPAGWFTDETRLALHVEADGAGVAAWLQSTRMEGETPRGNAWVSSTTPGTHLLIPALPSATRATLRIAVPGTQSAHVDIAQVSAAGSAPLPGGSFGVDGQTVLDIPLDGMNEAMSSMQITASAPVVAQIMTGDKGNDYPTGGQWESRAFLTPALPLNTITLPGAAELNDRIGAQLTAPLLRATSVETPHVSADTPLNPRYSLVLSAEDATRDVQVTVGDQKLSIPAGQLLTIDLPHTGTTLTSSAPVYGALKAQVSTPTGEISGTWVMGSAGTARHTVLVNARS